MNLIAMIRRLFRQRRNMRRAERLMRHVVESSVDAIVTVSHEGRIETFNPAAESMFGYPEAEAAGRPLAELVSCAGAGRRWADLVASAGRGLVEAKALRRNGRRLPVELVLTPIEGEEALRLVAVIRDTTERKAQQKELQHRATHDPLTELPNRALLVERMRRAIVTAARKRRELAVVLLDIDRFKQINDALGHAVGNLLLRAFAGRLSNALASDETLARLDGDAFALLLPGSDAGEAERTARKLAEVVRQPFSVDGLSVQVETSLGLTVYPEHGDDTESLLQQADVAMHVAKQEKRGVVVYGPQHDRDHMRQLTIKGELRNAIEQGRLQLVYQPKVDRDGERVIGCEALLRWPHERHGTIPPDECTGIAEHSGLIRPLTQWVLETALAQAAAWHREGMTIEMSVNLSTRNLLEEDLPQRVRALLRHHGLQPHVLTLEITESLIMGDLERTLATMHRLREIGVNLSVDDFGTGYSSLTYLAQLPANELKIDKSFVVELDRDPGRETIVLSTIELAHKLGMRVVAEGVETEAAWQLLKRAGCDVGQGDWFGRPDDAGKLAALVAECAAVV
jgi:diguanylate cyclase (GGDEF)-like protein/PAS domain S-box-containing protein